MWRGWSSPSAFLPGSRPEHKLRVIAPDVGGWLSAPRSTSTPRKIACLWASMKTGRSVKWTSDRSEAFMTDAHGRDHVTTAKMGFDAGWQDRGIPRGHDRQYRRLRVALRHGRRRTYLYGNALVGDSTTSPAIYRHGAGGPHQITVPPRRRLSRRGPAPRPPTLIERMIGGRPAREMGNGPRRIGAGRTSSRKFPYQTAGPPAI